MIKPFVILLFALSCFPLVAQDAISGYVSMANQAEWEQKVYLAKLNVADFPQLKLANPIAVSAIDEDGYFSFKRNLISDKDAIYRVHVNRIKRILKDTLRTGDLFLLSNSDSLRFKKSAQPFASYTNTNAADREWKKLRKFEASLQGFNLTDDKEFSNAYVQNIKTYTKDSLQILMVKLIGIKQLENKKLLDQDISKNPHYYLALLKELKESELDRSEYLFLENKLAFLTTEAIERKYRVSMVLNVLMGLMIAGLILLIYHRFGRKRNELSIVPLSRQEKHIRDLILAGKSNKDIASELYISLNTVKTHITNIYTKLRVSTRQELLQRDQN